MTIICILLILLFCFVCCNSFVVAVINGGKNIFKALMP